jgi:hypothetical protein
MRAIQTSATPLLDYSGNWLDLGLESNQKSSDTNGGNGMQKCRPGKPTDKDRREIRRAREGNFAIR